MSISTNRLNIQFHIDAIERDFAFIRFAREHKGNWYGAAQLDRLIGDDYKATAVMFQYGKYAYAMFKKPVDVYELLSRIRKDHEFGDSAVSEVVPRISRHDHEDSICEAWLVQTLLNSLSSSRSRFPQYHYCNLTGALLLVPNLEGNRKDYLDAAKITITSNYLLKVEIVRYRKIIAVLSELKNPPTAERQKTLRNALDGPNYIFHAATGSLRRHLPRDGRIDSKTGYVKCGLYRKKAPMPFLEFGRIDDFERSRGGILHLVLTNIQKHLSDYMAIALTSREPEHTIELTNSLLKKPDQLQAKLDGQPIRIVDRVGNEESANLAVSLKKSLLQYVTDSTLITEGKREKEGAFNFRIIHNIAYYEKTGEKDAYLPSTNTIQHQNITIESTTASNAVVKTLVKELLIKRDISAKRLSLFDWSRLKTQKKWTFGMCDEKAEQFIFMEIMPDGSFVFRETDGTDLFGHQEYRRYIDLIAEVKAGEWKTGLYFEGLVVSEENDVNLIFRSDEITLPNLAEIQSLLQEIERDLPEGVQCGDELAG
jgi:hypothetical protein